MKRKNKFGKRKIEESRGEFVIPSEPVRRGIDNLKAKYFTENSYENSYNNTNAMNTDDFNIPVKKPNNNNNSIPQSFYSNQFSNQNNVNQNPHFSAEYKLNNNNAYQANNMQNNNNNNNAYSGFNNMVSFGGYNPMGIGSMPGMNNVSNFIRPMGINPFAPPTFANNPNMNFSLNTNPGNNTNNNNSIFHTNHNLFNISNGGNPNENNNNQQN